MRGVVVAIGAFVLAACASTVEGQGGGGNGNGSGNGTGGPGTSGTNAGAGAGGGTSGANGTTSGGTSGEFVDPQGTAATRPPPTITSVAPLSGDYGTVVTITGDNLDESAAQLVLAGPAEPVKIGMPAAGTGAGNPSDVVMKWSKTEIQFKYPFPAEGVVSITTRSGQAQGGSFEPTWSPGAPLSGTFTRRELLALASPAAGTVVAAFDGATGPVLAIAQTGNVTSKAYDRGSAAIGNLSLVATASGVEGLFAAGGTLRHLTDALGSPTVTDTGVAVLDAAGSADATGLYAWIRKSDATLVRVRPPSWTEDGTPVTDPTPASAPGPSIAVSPDASLFVGWGVTDGGSFPFYDEVAYPVVRRLRAGQVAFDSERDVGQGADDIMLWTRFHAGPGGRVLSYYCANDTGLFESPSLDCAEGYIDGTGTLVSPGDAAHGEEVSGWNTSAAATASCDPATATLSLGPEGNTAAAAKVLFPCSTSTTAVLGVALDAAGDPMLLVTNGPYLYNPRKR